MKEYTDIIIIKGDWIGGNHGSYPKVLSVNPSKEKSFGVSEGWGHGFGGGVFTLQDLIIKKFVNVFNRDESQDIYEQSMMAYRSNIDSKEFAEKTFKSV
jgi:hypothetical protein